MPFLRESFSAPPLGVPFELNQGSNQARASWRVDAAGRMRGLRCVTCRGAIIPGSV